jgi:threonylcarbamoyladenosine tRNA methylthiotransferase MtaB
MELIWFWELQKFKITDYINDLSKNDFGVHSCEIADADFYVGSYSRRQTRAFLKVQDGCDYKCVL